MLGPLLIAAQLIQMIHRRYTPFPKLASVECLVYKVYMVINYDFIIITILFNFDNSILIWF